MGTTALRKRLERNPGLRSGNTAGSSWLSRWGGAPIPDSAGTGALLPRVFFALSGADRELGAVPLDGRVRLPDHADLRFRRGRRRHERPGDHAVIDGVGDDRRPGRAAV